MKKIGWRAKAPAPWERKVLCTDVGQAISSVSRPPGRLFARGKHLVLQEGSGSREDPRRPGGLSWGPPYKVVFYRSGVKFSLICTGDSTGLPFSIAGLYFHSITASIAAF